jgi:hypothetical protein
VQHSPASYRRRHQFSWQNHPPLLTISIILCRHPDKNPDPRATAEFQKISGAYRRLLEAGAGGQEDEYSSEEDEYDDEYDDDEYDEYGEDHAYQGHRFSAVSLHFCNLFIRDMFLVSWAVPFCLHVLRQGDFDGRQMVTLHDTFLFSRCVHLKQYFFIGHFLKIRI